jgi:HAD superfamily hydrolase (TIGR01549 family)
MMGRNPHSIIDRVNRTEAVFFDIDFTLLEPGRRFQAAGYFESCARHGIAVNPDRFEDAVAGAAPILDAAGHTYDPAVFVRYTARIIELMGGQSPAVEVVARELVDAWADHEHFDLYDDARDTLVDLAARGVRLGVISNSHRCLHTFQAHFALDGLLSAAVSSAASGFMKPDPRIFRAALDQAGVAPDRAVMVGDSVAHDVEGAIAAGMRGVLLARRGTPGSVRDDVPVISSLRELPLLLF